MVHGNCHRIFRLCSSPCTHSHALAFMQCSVCEGWVIVTQESRELWVKRTTSKYNKLSLFYYYYTFSLVEQHYSNVRIFFPLEIVPFGRLLHLTISKRGMLPSYCCWVHSIHLHPILTSSADHLWVKYDCVWSAFTPVFPLFYSPQLWSAYVPCSAQHLDAVQIAVEQIDVIRRLVDKYPAYLSLVTTVRGKHFLLIPSLTWFNQLGIFA